LAKKTVVRKTASKGRKRPAPTRVARADAADGLHEGERFSIPPALVEHILLGPIGDRRVLQDSPLLGDVWAAYAADPGVAQDLLITPRKEVSAAEVAQQISERVRHRESKSPARGDQSARVAHLQGIVGAELYFDEVLNILVPLTQWWSQKGITERIDAFDEARLRAVLNPARLRPPASGGSAVVAPGPEKFTSLERYITLACLIHWMGQQKPPRKGPLKTPDLKTALEFFHAHSADIASAMFELHAVVRESAKPAAKIAPRRRSGPRLTRDAATGIIFQVSLNRPASAALDRSVPAVKGDAAKMLFKVNCSAIVWAVLDCGIDGTHDAFITSDANQADRVSRVTRTFDFTNIRDIVSDAAADVAKETRDQIAETTGLKLAEIDARLKTIARGATERRPINWDVVEELITLEKPPTPASLHGTHVAGIIGADRHGNGKEGYADGMCPDIQFYDFRVLGKTMGDTEFAIIAALQYIRYVNERQSYITIHGANLSLSIPHNVRNFACGRTPICNECERLIDSGVVVVAAAGNHGFQKFETKDGSFESYAAFSITDPGNSDGVITVGSTHGNWPQTYGVSFFSSRGPTGDGRLKPDLVAPGERVMSTVPGSDWGAESGTSMAASHVSGAAAMLLARYEELIGQPRRLKRILCDSATDLGRERSFQGHGMLDVLRAFQSI
jgi:serine protease AprX